jgi:hypothetical protein
MINKFLIPVLFVLASCAGTNPATQSGTTGTTEQGSSEQKPEQAVAGDPVKEKEAAAQDKMRKGQAELYGVVVSFYSKGEGIDAKALHIYNTFLDGFEKQHNLNLNYVKTPWGREGEVDYCIPLNNMDSGKQSNFLMQTREILLQSQLVHILENAPCNHME